MTKLGAGFPLIIILLVFNVNFRFVVVDSKLDCNCRLLDRLTLNVVIFQGTARRKKKVVHRTATADDKKLQSSLKKLAVNNIAGIEEV